MHRRSVAALTVALTTVALSLPGEVTAGTASSPAAAAPTHSSQVILDWERTSFRTVYAEQTPPTPIPSGVLYLGFTSTAMHDAVKKAFRHGGSPVAAAAVAAHDVLVEYFPASMANLDADLTASLEDVADGSAKTKGMAVGATVAAKLIDRREDDGRNDTSIVYERDEEPGVWQPVDPAGNPFVPPFAVPWLGYVDPLVLEHRVRVNGPDPVRSAAYAFDVQEVKRVGSAAATADRTPYQTETAHFFNSNSATMVGAAVIELLEEEPMSLWRTSRLFAQMHGAMADSIIETWRLKFEEAFWRPYQAIQLAGTDGNPATVPDPGWMPLVANPAYPDYTSGHGGLTAPAVEVVRRTLGEETALTLVSANTAIPEAARTRTYGTLSELEFDAFHSRIWGGLHFRDAMEDAYHLGHETARRVMRALR
jgi:hypothetical protein